MAAVDDLHGFDDDAIRGELIRMLDREEARLSAEMHDNLMAQREEAEALGPEAQSIWHDVEGKIRDRGVLIFETMRNYVQRSR